MAKYDRMSTLFLAIFGVAICIESIRLDPGSLSEPGPGLFPLGCGLIIASLGVFIFIRTFRQKDEGHSIWERVTEWWNLVAIPASLISYAFLIDLLGFRLITFFWMAFICRGIGKMGWRGTVFTSLTTTVLTFILFQNYLGVHFPRGIFRF